MGACGEDEANWDLIGTAHHFNQLEDISAWDWSNTSYSTDAPHGRT